MHIIPNTINIYTHTQQTSKGILLKQNKKMWKNLTSPDLRIHNKYPRAHSHKNNINNNQICQNQQLSFSQTAQKLSKISKQNNQILIEDSHHFDTGSFQYEYQSKGSYEGQQKCIDHLRASDLGMSMNKSIISKNSRKQQLILSGIEQNQQLRVSLFRAEKTIQDLDAVCRSMHDKMIQLLQLKKQQIEQYDLQKIQIKSKLKKLSNKKLLDERETERINSLEGKGKGTDKQKQKQKQIRSMSKSKKNKKQNESGEKDEKQQQNLNLLDAVDALERKQKQNAQMWKKCYNDLIQYVSRYTQDISYLTEQYKLIQNKNQEYKKSSTKAKKNEQNLIKILKQSNSRLKRSQQMIQKAMEDIRQRDHKIQQYQIQNKDIKMKIIQLRQQIQQLKRQNKSISRQSHSYKQLAKSFKSQVDHLQNKFKQLQTSHQNQNKLRQILKDSQESLKNRILMLEQELHDTKCFNDNLMQQYKKVSIKIQNNQQKLSQKYMASELLYSQKVKQYQKFINTLKKQKQICTQKFHHKIEVAQTQIQKLYEIKNTLQKQLSDRSCIINQLKKQIIQNQQRYDNTQMELNTRLQQKQRQVEYLEELRAIANQKNQQLKIQLEELKVDMLTIIQQLKVKELEVEKYKQYSDFSMSSPKFQSWNKKRNQEQNNYFRLPNTQSKSKNKINQKKQEEIIKKLLNFPGICENIKFNQSPQGLIWKQLKKDSGCEQSSIECSNKKQNKKIEKINARTIQDSNDDQQFSLYPPEKSKQFPLKNHPKFRQQIFLDQQIQNEQNQQNQQYQNSNSNFNFNLNEEQNYDSNIDMPHLQCLPKVNQTNNNGIGQKTLKIKTMNENHQKQVIETPKNKFSLQAFQNKIMIEEGAKILMKFNKTMFK